MSFRRILRFNFSNYVSSWQTIAVAVVLSISNNLSRFTSHILPFLSEFEAQIINPIFLSLMSASKGSLCDNSLIISRQSTDRRLMSTNPYLPKPSPVTKKLRSISMSFLQRQGFPESANYPLLRPRPTRQYRVLTTSSFSLAYRMK